MATLRLPRMAKLPVAHIGGNSQACCFPPSRFLSSSSSSAGPAHDWLVAEAGVSGWRADRVVAELKKSGISASQMPSVLKSMGVAGLEQLLAAIDTAEAQRAGTAPVSFKVSVPRERHTFEVTCARCHARGGGHGEASQTGIGGAPPFLAAQARFFLPGLGALRGEPAGAC